MKLVIVAVICLTVYTVALPTNAADSCDSPLNYFMSIVGKDVIHMVKMMAMMKMKGSCLNIGLPPQDLMDDMKTCMTETATNIMAEIGKRSNSQKFFGHKDLMKFNKDFQTCELKKNAGINLNNGLRMEAFRDACKKTFTVMAKDEETKDLLTEVMTRCTKLHLKGARGDGAIKELIKIKSCIAGSVIMECKKMNKDPGMFMKISKAFLTLVDEPKCIASIKEEVMSEPFDKCLQEANNAWRNNNDLPNKFTLVSNDPQQNIETAIKFFKNYGKHILMKSCDCMAYKLGFASKTETNNVAISRSKILDFVMNFKWKNVTEKETVVNMYMKCMPRNDDPMLTEMDNMIEMCGKDESMKEMHTMMIHKKVMMFRMKTDMCMMPDYVMTCGLNNDLSRTMMPLLNYGYMNTMTKDFMDKGGMIAGMHIMGALREKFDFTKMMD